MSKQQAGFTLIELVVIIVVLGILAAIAIPKYVDLTEDAKIAVEKGALGALASAAALSIADTLGTKPNRATIIAATQVTPDVVIGGVTGSCSFTVKASGGSGGGVGTTLDLGSGGAALCLP